MIRRLTQRKLIRAYQNAFETDSGKMVLEDLYRLCATKMNVPDAHHASLHVGRYAVWSHIRSMLSLRPDEEVRIHQQVTETSERNMAS